jgi:hypothetical protein
VYDLREVRFDRAPQWDAAISGFSSAHLYHLGCWLDFVEETQNVVRRIYGIYEGGEIVGYLPGFIVQKGPIRVFGSPLPGWTTDYLGPVISPSVDQQGLWSAIAETFKRDHFHYAELCHRQLDVAAGVECGFRTMVRRTYVSPIPANEDDLFDSFSKSTRKVVRRALRRGLRAMTCTDPAFIDCYYDQLIAVFAKCAIAPTYPIDRVRALWKHLLEALDANWPPAKHDGHERRSMRRNAY